MYVMNNIAARLVRYDRLAMQSIVKGNIIKLVPSVPPGAMNDLATCGMS